MKMEQLNGIHSDMRPDESQDSGSAMLPVTILFDSLSTNSPQNGESSGVSTLREKTDCVRLFEGWSEPDQIDFIQGLLSKMSHCQHSQINTYLKPMLQRDFISLLPKGGLDHVAEKILTYLDGKSLCNAELVCQEWHRVISLGMLWKKLIEHQVRVNYIWREMSKRRGWSRFLFKMPDLDQRPDHLFYKRLYPEIIKDIENMEKNWRSGTHTLQKINCRSENSRGVYCLQYDDKKIVSGLRDNTIKVWDRESLECREVLMGHTGSVLCLQYDEKVIVSGSSDATVRVWDISNGEMVNTLIHHSEAVLHLRFSSDLMVTCSKDRSIAVWDIKSPTDITLRRVLVGHRAAVNVVDFDEKYIVSASGDRTIKVWDTNTCEFVRTLSGHKRGIACLQYRDNLVVSGSSDNTIKLWDIELGTCLRTLEGHEELVRCIRFDSKRIVSGAYDGKIKVWDLNAALDPRSHESTLCLKTLNEHTGRVFRLQFDEFQIVSSSHDDTILIWDFLGGEPPLEFKKYFTPPRDDSNDTSGNNSHSSSGSSNDSLNHGAAGGGLDNGSENGASGLDKPHERPHGNGTFGQLENSGGQQLLFGDHLPSWARDCETEEAQRARLLRPFQCFAPAQVEDHEMNIENQPSEEMEACAIASSSSGSHSGPSTPASPSGEHCLGNCINLYNIEPNDASTSSESASNCNIDCNSKSLFASSSPFIHS